MPSPPEQPKPAKHTSRVPHSLFYDRVVPALLVVLALILVTIIVLVIGALAGMVPIK